MKTNYMPRLAATRTKLLNTAIGDRDRAYDAVQAAYELRGARLNAKLPAPRDDLDRALSAHDQAHHRLALYE